MKILPSLAFFAVGLMCGCTTVPRDDLAGPKCEVHNMPLRVGVSPILYGLVAPSPPVNTASPGFVPSYARGFVLGGCLKAPNAPDFAAVLYCPECRRLDPTWKDGKIQRIWEESRSRAAAGQSFVEIEVLVVEVDGQATPPLGKRTAEWVLGLVVGKKATILSAPLIRTELGQEAVFRAVKEVIYPTTFTFSAGNPSNATEEATMLVAPDDFETREVGTILIARAELDPASGGIRVSATPEIVSPPEWKDYGTDYTDANGRIHHASMQQPFFPTITFTADLVVQDGVPVLIGGGAPSDDHKRIVYCVLTARLEANGVASPRSTTGVDE